jgi:hypothetical protein
MRTLYLTLGEPRCQASEVPHFIYSSNVRNLLRAIFKSDDMNRKEMDWEHLQDEWSSNSSG